MVAPTGEATRLAVGEAVCHHEAVQRHRMGRWVVQFESVQRAALGGHLVDDRANVVQSGAGVGALGVRAVFTGHRKVAVNAGEGACQSVPWPTVDTGGR